MTFGLKTTAAALGIMVGATALGGAAQAAQSWALWASSGMGTHRIGVFETLSACEAAAKMRASQSTVWSYRCRAVD